LVRLLCIGGEDHALRIPFLLALRDRGFRVSAAATADRGSAERPSARAARWCGLAEKITDPRCPMRTSELIGAG